MPRQRKRVVPLPIRPGILLPLLAGFALMAAGLACATPDLGGGADTEATTLRVSADEPWTDTGLDLRLGDRVTIEYVSGEWSPWPGESYDALGSGGDPRCDCNVILGVSHAALIGRIGDGQPFLVGEEYAGAAGETGRLYLGMNDTRLEDNSGSIRVRVQVLR